MLKKISLQALQYALDQALGLDPNLKEALKPLDQKVIEMVVSPLDVHFYISILAGRLILSTKIDQQPDTVIYSNPMGFIRLSLLPASKMRSLFNDEIRISGDLELGRDLKKIMDGMQIDWEGHLAYFTGDVAAHHIGRMLRKGRDLSREFRQSFKENTQDYLTNELEILPSAKEVDEFNQAVDDLRLRSERLSAHLNQWLVKHEIS
jgi:ubiquinone biosynthesis protein UbiJ